MTTNRTFNAASVETFEVKFDIRACHPMIDEAKMASIVEEALRVASRAINAASNIGLDASYETISVTKLDLDEDLV